jgi:hypothetical protein
MPEIGIELIRVWFQAQLIRYAGHMPNLTSDTLNEKLRADQLYNFDFDSVAFSASQEGRFSSDHIKFLRLVFSGSTPQVLTHINGLDTLLPDSESLVQTMLQTYIRI